jgi:hypothetical protein
LQVLQAQNPKMRALQATHYTGQRTNFFTLLRFDFMLDQNANSYLIEVSPRRWPCAASQRCVCAAWPEAARNSRQ